MRFARSIEGRACQRRLAGANTADRNHPAAVPTSVAAAKYITDLLPEKASAIMRAALMTCSDERLTLNACNDPAPWSQLPAQANPRHGTAKRIRYQRIAPASAASSAPNAAGMAHQPIAATSSPSTRAPACPVAHTLSRDVRSA